MSKNKEKIKVLYIDDEGNNLTAFQATFRREFEVYTATSAAEAMGVLTENEVHIIISDQRMPKTTGTEFFDVVRKAFPEPIRILITGFTDIDAIVDAINKGEIFRYLKKPWSEFELRTTIQNAFDLYTAQKELKDKVLELQKANDDLNRFVYSTSHDLRSPLASIMGVLNLAKMENSVVDPNNYLGMIQICVERMDNFVHKIIEYYKSIRVENFTEEINFRKLLQESIDLAKLQDPKIEFDVQISQEVVFNSDEFRLSVIVNNLISNAVKYQRPEEEHKQVKLRVEVTDEKAIIKIEDNGIGILHEHLKNIFNMFFRSANTVSGLGIGLYIVKEALARIGGDISVDSEKGVGTMFVVTAPNKKI
jgi:signal transduction histidine kinase